MFKKCYISKPPLLHSPSFPLFLKQASHCAQKWMKDGAESRMKVRSPAIRCELTACEGIKQPLIAQDVAAQLLTLSLSPILCSPFGITMETSHWENNLAEESDIHVVCYCTLGEKRDGGEKKKKKRDAQWH